MFSKLNEKEINELKGSCDRLLQNSSSCIIATDNGCSIVGAEPEVMALLTNLLEHLKKECGITQDKIEWAVNLSKMSINEKQKLLLEELKKTMEKVSGKINEGKDE